MKIGIMLYKFDHSYKGGVMAYVMGLLEGFAHSSKEHTYVLFTNKKNNPFLKDHFSVYTNFQFLNIDEGQGDQKRYVAKIINYLFLEYIGILPLINRFFKKFIMWSYRVLIAAIDTSGCDVVYVPYLFPIYSKIPTVTSIHDIQHVHFPQFFSWRERLGRNVFFRETVKSSTCIQASSQYMQQDFIKYFHLKPTQVPVVRDGVDEIFKQPVEQSCIDEVKQKYNLTQPFIFYPAQHWPHKNHRLLIDALGILQKSYGVKIQAVFTGKISKEHRSLYEYIGASPIAQNIKLVGNVDFKELRAFYKLCTLVVVPTLHESNSLIIMEAMSLGCCIMASDIEPNKELNHPESFVIFSQTEPHDLAEKIKSLLNHPNHRGELAQLAEQVSKSFSWNTTTQEYLNVFSRIIT